MHICSTHAEPNNQLWAGNLACCELPRPTSVLSKSTFSS